MTRTLTLVAAAATIAFTGLSFNATDAEAKRGSRYQQWEFDSSHPVKGYEGFAGGSGIGNYCSYRREPERKCWETRYGETCKIVSWRLIQKCY